MIGRNDPCWCGSGRKWKRCHAPAQGPEKEDNLQRIYRKQYGIILKSAQEIEGIRRASQLAASILADACSMVSVGVTTEEIDQFVREAHRQSGAVPAPLGYGSPPYPKAICTSINEVICHGIPDDRPLENGEIMNIDVTSILDGFYGDTSAMVCVGDVSSDKKRLVDTAFRCLVDAMDVLKPGLPLCVIGQAIEKRAHAEEFSVVNQFVGHGVGLAFHEEPQIFHYDNQVQTPLVAGMTFTIEPMINLGCREAVIDSHDGWTARTADGEPSAQWEHTVLITDTGYEILTQRY